MRRLSLALGSTGLATTLTLAVYMGGLGIGGLVSTVVKWRRPPMGYGILEILAACWTLAFPLLLIWLTPLGDVGAAVALLLPPALLHGATLPAAAASITQSKQTVRLYAANTAGAVLGVVLAAFLWMPLLGVRGTELLAAAAGFSAGILALLLARRPRWETPVTKSPPTPASGAVPGSILWMVTISGAAAMALEGAWSRLTALLLGGSVYAFATVLGVFLLGVAIGAELGRRWGAKALSPAMALLGLLAAAGTAGWRILPHGLALGWAAFGEDGQLLTGATLMAIAMAGAPIASGVVFAASLQSAEQCSPQRAAGQILAANTLGGVIGICLASLVGLPAIGIRGTVLIVAGICVTTSTIYASKRLVKIGAPVTLLGLVALSPRWDPAIYAVGIYAQISDFVDHSPRAIESFAHDGWNLLYYADGRTATVAVGESIHTGNRWLSINGKVDASTGGDMPTQELSGQIPLAVANNSASEALVIGLASGVTAVETLRSGAEAVTVIELEPAVVEASTFFSHVNGSLHIDPRATIIVDDARAVLRRRNQMWPVIISEPSNPWITGVSNLFTLQYWQLVDSRLAPDGVFCQWVQLYALPPSSLRSLVRTFLTVFPRAWLFETIRGADALLIAAPSLPDDLPIQPTLGPEGLARLAGRAPLNTDDQPRVEFEAPHWLHRSTAVQNVELIERAR